MEQLLEKYVLKNYYILKQQKFRQKTVNFDYVTGENNQTQLKLTIYSRPSIQDSND